MLVFVLILLSPMNVKMLNKNKKYIIKYTEIYIVKTCLKNPRRGPEGGG